MHIPNHTSRVKVLQLCEQTSQRLWLMRQPNHLVQQNHLKAAVATWCKYHGGWQLGLAPQIWSRLTGWKQRCSWSPFLRPVPCFWQWVPHSPTHLRHRQNQPSLPAEFNPVPYVPLFVPSLCSTFCSFTFEQYQAQEQTENHTTCTKTL